MSSIVWCVSTSRSPVRRDREVEAAVLAELLEHVVEERDAGRRRRVAVPVEHEVDVDVGLLGGPVPRGRSGVIGLIDAPLSRSARPATVRKASFSAGVPTVTRRQSSTPGQLEKSRTSTPRSTSASQTARGHAPGGRGTAGSSRRTGTPRCRRARRARRTAAHAPRPGTGPGLSISSTWSSARIPASCVATSRWYGSTTLSSSATTHGRDARSRGAARRATTPWSTCASTTSARSSSTSVERGATARTRRTPRRRSRARARRRGSPATVAGGSTVPVGLFGLHRNTISGCSRSITPTRVVGVDAEVVAARRRDDLGAR